MSDDLNQLIDPELVEVISVGNLCVPLECTISEYISYTTNEYVNQTLSAHNISLSAHQDIRDLIARDNNVLSAYAPLSGANFFGNILASNLSGVNTGDQDLSPYALSGDLFNLSNSLSSYALQPFVTSSISEHNISEYSHQDIRTSITNISNSLSSYALSADVLSNLNDKVDKVYSATSGNLAMFNASGNIEDSNLPLSACLVLDNDGLINQMKYLPTILLQNRTPSMSAHYVHEVWVETNEFDEDYIVVGRTFIPIYYLWTGAVDNNLENPLNYTPNGNPVSGDTVTFEDGFINIPSTGTLDADVTNNLITYIVNGGVYNGTFTNFGSLGNVVCNGTVFNIGQGSSIIAGEYNGLVTCDPELANGSPIIFDPDFYDTYPIFNGHVELCKLIIRSGVFDAANVFIGDNGTFEGTVNLYNPGSISSLTGDHVFRGLIYSDGTIDNGSFHAPVFNGGIINGGLFYDWLSNFYGTVNNASIIGESGYLSDEEGSPVVSQATFIPTGSTGNWTYPTNNATITTANIYWDEVDNTLGGYVTTANYLGYPI